MKRAGAWLLTASLLAGCSLEHEEDLVAWMEAARKRQPPVPGQAIPELVTPAFRYEAGTRGDPFDPTRLSVAGGVAGGAAGGAGIEPDLRRAREPLESFALDRLRLVGILRRGAERVALVEADRLIYSVRPGGHLGQDFGKVAAINEDSIEIEELVRDGGGTWSPRRAQLRLEGR